MIKIAIVEDEIKEQENLLACLKELQQQEMVSLETQTFSNASSFLEAYRHNFDIVFFDIEMDGLNGMDAAKELRQLDKSVIIIFVTNLAQMAVKGYEVEALDFIVKPIEKATFLLKMKRVLNRTSSKLEESLNIQEKDGDFKVIHTKDIYYVETSGHYVIYHTSDGDVMEYNTLKAVEKKIHQDKIFVRCNRCYLVNLQYLDGVKKENAIIHGTPLLISRPQRKQFLEDVSAFLGGQ